MTKIIFKGIVIAVLVIGAIFLWESTKNGVLNIFGIKSVETTHDIVIQKVKALGKLELASYTFKDIVEQNIEVDFLPDPKALLIVYGVAKGCIDLTKISEENISVDATTIRIELPAPELCQYSIDHSKSRIYDAQYAFMNEAVLFEEAFKSAELKLKETAISSGILKSTKENAMTILKPFLENITDKKVILTFKE